MARAYLLLDRLNDRATGEHLPSSRKGERAISARATSSASRFPIEFGWTHTIDTENVSGVNAQKPLIQAEIVKTDHPVFYGYPDKIFPIKYEGGPVFRVGVADQGNILARYVGGDTASTAAATRATPE